MYDLELDISQLSACQRMAQAVADSYLKLAGRPPLTIALRGTLGAGKTQWIRFFCASLGVVDETVTSPTYVLLQHYVGVREIYHFDFYRLENEPQVWDLGIDELFELPVVVLVEWADKFPQCLPDDRLEIALEQNNNGSRIAKIAGGGICSQKIVEDLSVGGLARPS